MNKWDSVLFFWIGNEFSTKLDAKKPYFLTPCRKR